MPGSAKDSGSLSKLVPLSREDDIRLELLIISTCTIILTVTAVLGGLAVWALCWGDGSQVEEDHGEQVTRS